MIEMKEIEPGLKHTLSVWWLIAWRATVTAVAVGLVVGAGIGITGYALGWPQQVINAVAQPVGALIGLACNFVFLRSALRKRYKDFRIVLIPEARPA